MTRFRGIKFTELPIFEIWIGEKEREFVRGSCDLNLTCQLFENGMFLFLENRTIESYIDMRRTHTHTHASLFVLLAVLPLWNWYTEGSVDNRPNMISW